MMAIVVKGDALSPEQVQKAFDQIEEVDAVVSTIGGTPADPAADSQVPKLAPDYCFVIPASLAVLSHGCTLLHIPLLEQDLALVSADMCGTQLFSAVHR